ncbi:hypothetical protein RclHR1_01160018 [Rhizophagus clarus]|uniref:Required for respiratory growth protein 9, mitochondrial n=1 Tax=Rhizophagus clarus TaxID=94130 RepID=A0A2Z6QJU6_9GLOM|nr:hypothetical protein RclHR1_01160018 [Rhizophagus clarus]GET01393.1 required for respiratory growth protein 9, mitochondrial [Rhizophagus clarus]
MVSFFNPRDIFNTNNSRLLLTISRNTFSSLFVSKPHICIIITRNIFWQHNALRRIAEKEEKTKKNLEKVGQNTVEKNKVNKRKFEKSGLKTSIIKEIFDKKETPAKKQDSEKQKRDRKIEEKKTDKYKQDLTRQIQLHQTSRLNKRIFLLRMINRKCNPNLSITNTPIRKKKKNPEEISASLLSHDNKTINYDPNWRENENLPGWLKHKFAMKERIGFKHWKPHKRVNREIMDKIRWLHNQFPEEYNAEKLSNHFKISPESIRRIIKSKFIPNSEILERQEQKYREKLIKFKEKQKERRKAKIPQQKNKK